MRNVILQSNVFSGACYLDFPGNLLSQTISVTEILSLEPCPPPALLYPDIKLIAKVVNMIQLAQKPLIIIGKGTLFQSFEIILR